MTAHKHTINCYLRDAHGGLVYTPCRADGLDRNLRTLKEVDFRAGLGLRGLTLVCTLQEAEQSKGAEQLSEANGPCPEDHSDE